MMVAGGMGEERKGELVINRHKVSVVQNEKALNLLYKVHKVHTAALYT
jgi:hypothetical protein